MMYDIVNDFIVERFIGVDNALAKILTDVSIVLMYVALVYMLIWVFRVASRIIKL